MPSPSSSLLRRIRLLPIPFSDQQRPISAAALAAAGSHASPDSPTIKFLTDHCNLSLPAAFSAARSIRIDESSSEAPLAVVSLLRSHGLSPSQVARVVGRRPTVLATRAERTLAPKLHFLASFLPPSHLAHLVVANPTLLSRNLKAHIEPLFSLVRSFLDSPDEIVHAVHRAPLMLTCNFNATVVPNIALLISRGVPSDHVVKLFATHPRTFMVCTADFAAAVDISISLGVRPDTSLFIHAVRALNGMRRSTWDARFEVFRRLGWTEEEFRNAFQKAPLFVLVSEDKIKKMVEFLTEEVGLKASDLSRQPKLLMYSLERRLLPRFRVFRWLEEKGLLKGASGSKRNGLITGMFTCNEQMFLHRYLRRHSEIAPELVDIFDPEEGVVLQS